MGWAARELRHFRSTKVPGRRDEGLSVEEDLELHDVRTVIVRTSDEGAYVPVCAICDIVVERDNLGVWMHTEEI